MQATALIVFQQVAGLRLPGALVLLAFAPPLARAQPIRSDFHIANVTINAELLRGDTLYVGGSCSAHGPFTGSAVPLDAGTGAALPGFAQVTGQVYAALPDGAGGWFLGGSFTSVGGVPRANLAHVLADHSVAPWNPGANDVVRALARRGSVLYAAGNFTSAGGQARSRIAAIDSASGLATA